MFWRESFLQKILVYNLDFIKGRRFHLFCCHWNVYFRYLTLSPCPPISNFRSNLDCGCQPASVRSSSISPHNAGESIQVRPDTSQHGHSELQAHPPTSSGVESSGEAGNQHQKDGEGVQRWERLFSRYRWSSGVRLLASSWGRSCLPMEKMTGSGTIVWGV